MHVAWPVDGWYVPAAHGSHAVCRVSGCAVVAAHAVRTPPVHKWPGSQSVHDAAPAAL